MSVVMTWTALVPVGYVLISATVYFGFLESLRNWAKIGAAPAAPLLKHLVMSQEWQGDHENMLGTYTYNRLRR
jgi:hypothetical protein